MVTWSSRNRFIYGGIVIVAVVALIVVPVFLLLYKAPTCSDGKKNQDEQGVDCGGSCSKLCADRFLEPRVTWTRADKVTSNLYNFAAYVINPNIDVEAKGVPFTMNVYDKTGLFILSKKATMDIPAHRNSLAFVPGIDMGARVPARIAFEFDGKPNWVKANQDKLVPVSIDNEVYEEDDTGGRLTADIKNPSLLPIGRILFYGIIYDGEGNTLGFSETYLDGLEGEATESIGFTWPTKRLTPVVRKEIIPIIVGLN